MSTIFCGRGTTVRFCTPGGVTLVVAVAFEFSVDVWQPARIESRALHKTMAGAEYLERVIVGLHGKSIRMLFSPSRLSQKAGREQALPVKFLWSAHMFSVGLLADEAGSSPLLNSRTKRRLNAMPAFGCVYRPRPNRYLKRTLRCTSAGRPVCNPAGMRAPKHPSPAPD